MTVTKNITIPEAKKLIENDEIIVLDVRAPWEFSEGHIKDAKNIDVSDPDFSKNIEKLDKNKEYILYCKTGRRSDFAADIMLKSGFSKVYNLIGGYEGWKRH